MHYSKTTIQEYTAPTCEEFAIRSAGVLCGSGDGLKIIDDDDIDDESGDWKF